METHHNKASFCSPPSCYCDVNKVGIKPRPHRHILPDGFIRTIRFFFTFDLCRNATENNMKTFSFLSVSLTTQSFCCGDGGGPTLWDGGPARWGRCGRSTRTPGGACACAGTPPSGWPGWRASAAAQTDEQVINMLLPWQPATAAAPPPASLMTPPQTVFDALFWRKKTTNVHLSSFLILDHWTETVRDDGQTSVYSAFILKYFSWILFWKSMLQF